MGPKQKVLTGHQILLPKHSANDIIMRALLLWEFLSCKIRVLLSSSGITWKEIIDQRDKYWSKLNH